MQNNGRRTLIGESRAMRELREDIERVARSDAKVLITGESGVGKELVANAVHQHSLRVNRPFVAVNCAGIPETLLESELFGHVKGSFTGAYRDAPGKLEIVDKGSIFLDEIGEMTPRMQGLLLRFLETGEVQKVGAHHAGGRLDVRVISATNRDLRDLIHQGQFREDLFYRLNVIHITVPPLRDRKEDIPLLIDHFLQVNGSKNGHRVPAISAEARALLAAQPWQGNIRELQNVVERLIVRARTDEVTVDDLPPEVRAQPGMSVRPKRERRKTVADELYKRMLNNNESFWDTVHPLYMQREITRSNVRELVHKGLTDSRGSYKIMARTFNIEPHHYKRFLNFLRKHNCQLPFKDYRA